MGRKRSRGSRWARGDIKVQKRKLIMKKEEEAEPRKRQSKADTSNEKIVEIEPSSNKKIVEAGPSNVKITRTRASNKKVETEPVIEKPSDNTAQISTPAEPKDNELQKALESVYKKVSSVKDDAVRARLIDNIKNLVASDAPAESLSNLIESASTAVESEKRPREPSAEKVENPPKKAKTDVSETNTRKTRTRQPRKTYCNNKIEEEKLPVDYKALYGLKEVKICLKRLTEQDIQKEKESLQPKVSFNEKQFCVKRCDVTGKIYLSAVPKTSTAKTHSIKTSTNDICPLKIAVIKEKPEKMAEEKIEEKIVEKQPDVITLNEGNDSDQFEMLEDSEGETVATFGNPEYFTGESPNFPLTSELPTEKPQISSFHSQFETSLAERNPESGIAIQGWPKSVKKVSKMKPKNEDSEILNQDPEPNIIMNDSDYLTIISPPKPQNQFKATSTSTSEIPLLKGNDLPNSFKIPQFFPAVPSVIPTKPNAIPQQISRIRVKSFANESNLSNLFDKPSLVSSYPSPNEVSDVVVPQSTDIKTASEKMKVKVQVYHSDIDFEKMNVKAHEPTPLTTTGYMNLRPWISQSYQGLKTQAHGLAMLEKVCLYANFKCMFSNCCFFTQSPVVFRRHLFLHASYCHDFDVACAYCHNSFKLIDDLISHITRMHVYNKYQCPYCFYRSCVDSNVIFHIKKYHSSFPKLVMEVSAKERLEEHEYEFMLESRKQYVPPIVCVCKYFLF